MINDHHSNYKLCVFSLGHKRKIEYRHKSEFSNGQIFVIASFGEPQNLLMLQHTALRPTKPNSIFTHFSHIIDGAQSTHVSRLCHNGVRAQLGLIIVIWCAFRVAHAHTHRTNRARIESNKTQTHTNTYISMLIFACAFMLANLPYLCFIFIFIFLQQVCWTIAVLTKNKHMHKQNEL